METIVTTMKTNFSRKTINTCIYLKKKTVIYNKRGDKQVHIMKASNKQKSFPKSTVIFIHFLINKNERTGNG